MMVVLASVQFLIVLVVITCGHAVCDMYWCVHGDVDLCTTSPLQGTHLNPGFSRMEYAEIQDKIQAWDPGSRIVIPSEQSHICCQCLNGGGAMV